MSEESKLAWWVEGGWLRLKFTAVRLDEIVSAGLGVGRDEDGWVGFWVQMRNGRELTFQVPEASVGALLEVVTSYGKRLLMETSWYDEAAP